MSKKNELRIKDVPLYVKEKTGVTVSRATAYNWVTSGRITYDGERKLLKLISKFPVRLTTEELVDDFIKDLQEVR